MDLKELTSGTPATKPWLTIVAKSVAVETATIDTVEIKEVHADLLSLTDTGAVPNPPIGSVSFYSTGTELKSVDPLGSESTFLTTSNCGDLVHTEELAAAQNQLDPLAPAGVRDLWQRGDNTLSGMGPQIVYLPELDIILSTPLTAGALYYSADGGENFSPCVFDVPPFDFVFPGWNGSVVTTLGYAGTDPSYTSVDGINYVAGPVPPAGLWSWSIEWFKGLFVAGAVIGVNYRVLTSPNGVNWTVRVIPPAITDPVGIIANPDVITICGATGGMYSTDGITWALTTGDPLIAQCGAWSSNQNIFAATGLSSTVFTSPDGIAWLASNSDAPGGNPINMIWVPRFDKFYVPARSLISNGDNYSLWYATDPALGFSRVNQDGADADSMAYSKVIYDASRDRFVIGLYDTLQHCAYSTARPLAIKSASDEIRVRGQPVSVGQYSRSASVLVVNTAVETSLTPTSDSLGSMVLQSGVPEGMAIEFTAFLLVSSVAGDSLTLTVKTQATTLYSDTLTIPALANKLPISVRGLITIQSGIAAVNTVTVQDAATHITLQSGTFVTTDKNTLDLTAYWGAAASSLECQQVVLSTHFRNGS